MSSFSRCSLQKGATWTAILFLLYLLFLIVYPSKKETITILAPIQEQQGIQSDEEADHNPRTLQSDPNPIVFLIGFHKVGTRSTYSLFQESGIPSVHNDRFNGKRFPNKTTAALIMSKNYRQNRSILSYLNPPYRFFSDFNTSPKFSNGSKIGIPWYRLAVDQYPGSKFILQIRSINPWLHSKFTHWHLGDGFIPDTLRNGTDHKREPVILNGTVIELSDYDEETGNIFILKSWREEWYQYMCDVLHLFQFERKELSDDLLIFDIEHDDPQKIVDFAAGFGMKLEAQYYSHAGDTAKSHVPGLALQLEKWDNITKREPMFMEKDKFETETERILAHCLDRESRKTHCD